MQAFLITTKSPSRLDGDRALLNKGVIMNTEIIPTHIKQINIGDTVMVNGQMKTVSRTSFGGDDFMGLTLFGDSYHLGRKLVDKVII